MIHIKLIYFLGFIITGMKKESNIFKETKTKKIFKQETKKPKNKFTYFISDNQNNKYGFHDCSNYGLEVNPNHKEDEIFSRNNSYKFNMHSPVTKNYFNIINYKCIKMTLIKYMENHTYYPIEDLKSYLLKYIFSDETKYCLLEFLQSKKESGIILLRDLSFYTGLLKEGEEKLFENEKSLLRKKINFIKPFNYEYIDEEKNPNDNGCEVKVAINKILDSNKNIEKIIFKYTKTDFVSQDIIYEILLANKKVTSMKDLEELCKTGNKKSNLLHEKNLRKYGLNPLSMRFVIKDVYDNIFNIIKTTKYIENLYIDLNNIKEYKNFSYLSEQNFNLMDETSKHFFNFIEEKKPMLLENEKNLLNNI